MERVRYASAYPAKIITVSDRLSNDTPVASDNVSDKAAMNDNLGDKSIDKLLAYLSEPKAN